MIDGYLSAMESLFTGLSEADTIKQNEDAMASPILLTREIAGKIWVAACQYTNGTDFHGNKVDAPDFETFYKQLIEGI